MGVPYISKNNTEAVLEGQEAFEPAAITRRMEFSHTSKSNTESVLDGQGAFRPARISTLDKKKI